MKNLLLLITLITLSCNPPEEPIITYYNHDSTDGQITKIVSDEHGIISQEQVEAEWEDVPEVSTEMSSYETLDKIGEKMNRDKAKKAEAERIAFENWLNE